MAEEPRVVQPLVVMPPPVDVSPLADDEADRFTQDLSLPSNLTFQEWVARSRPLPPMEKVPNAGVLMDDIPD